MSKLNIQLEVMQGMPVTTTRRISEVFGKRHDNVLRDVQELIGAFYVNRGLLKSEEAPISVISNNENEYYTSLYKIMERTSSFNHLKIN